MRRTVRLIIDNVIKQSVNFGHRWLYLIVEKLLWLLGFGPLLPQTSLQFSYQRHYYFLVITSVEYMLYIKGMHCGFE